MLKSVSDAESPEMATALKAKRRQSGNDAVYEVCSGRGIGDAVEGVRYRGGIGEKVVGPSP